MDYLVSILILGLLWHHRASASPEASPPSVSNTNSSITILYQNNLNVSDDGNHIPIILLDSMTHQQGAAACSALGEDIISQDLLSSHETDVYFSLAYLEYSGAAEQGQRYYIQNGTVAIDRQTDSLTFSQCEETDDVEELPILCTQAGFDIGKGNTSVSSGGNLFAGFRNQKAFQFLGIPYANQPARFEYSEVYNQTGRAIQATSYGSDCTQLFEAASSEDCLFLNIQTPYLPKPGSPAKLKPVLFSIHGGAFAVGSGRLDASNLASREDIVNVELNYRLSTLGFFAVPGTEIKGNFGLGDQVTALRWVRQNIAQFGGDPYRITIMGDSAGAGSVRALLGSPPVIQEDLIIGAIAQSNLGGGVTLGLDSNFGTPYSSYVTIDQAFAVAGQQILQAAGCNQTSLDEQITCLKGVPADTLVGLPAVAVIQDGYFINTEQLIVSTKNDSTAHVNVIFGTTANDGASFSTFPSANISSEAEGISQSLGISAEYAQAIISSGLYPFYDTGNLTLDSFNVSQRVATDTTFRCVDEATVYAAAISGAFNASYYYTFDRTYEGFDPNNLGASGLSQGAISAAFPFGDPNQPYFRLHGADLGFAYGSQDPLRDENDLLTNQLISGYFAQFARTGDPNPDEEYLRVRGYLDALEQVKESGRWEAVGSETGPSKILDSVSRTVEFPNLEQCTWLNYSIKYYLEGGK